MSTFKLLIRPSKSEQDFAEKLSNSFKSLKVEGRGTVSVDVSEVQKSEAFRKQLTRARALVAK